MKSDSNSTRWTRLISSSQAARRCWQVSVAGTLIGLSLGLLWLWLMPPPAQAQGPVDFNLSFISADRKSTFSLAWGDMDGDGDLDLAVGNYGDGNQLYRNDGGGRFTEVVGALGLDTKYTESVAWGDMDGDGDLDLAVGNKTGFNKSGVNELYRNDGGGRFTKVAGALGLDTKDTESVAWGDMDGDGDLDLAVGNDGDVNQLYRNDGGGSFTEVAGALGPDTKWTESVAWGDVDGDGDLDLAVGNSGDVNQLYRNDGGGGFTEVAGALGPDTNTKSVAWGDADGDGDLDLAAGRQVYENDGGSLSLAWDGGGGGSSVAWGDADGDGDLDLAVGNWNDVTQIYRNDGGGGFTEVAGALGLTTKNTESVAWGDMDGDGDLDLAVGNTIDVGKSGVNELYRNDGGGSFTEVAGALGLDIEQTTSLAWGDMDGDGDLDLAVSNSGKLGDVTQIYRNDGSGGFNEVWHAYSKEPWSVAWGDMDGDGDLDLAVGNHGGWSGEVNQLYRNDGGGGFTEVVGALGSDTKPTVSVAWGDMDGDGDLDLAVGNGGDKQVYQNDGGSFSLAWESAGGASSVAWGDADGDGDLDLAAGRQVYENDGGSLSLAWDGGGGGSSVAWGDMDGDGNLDLAVGNHGGVNQIYCNDGSGRFTEVEGALGPHTKDTESVAWGDWDGDGDLDLAVGNYGYYLYGYGQVNQLYRNDGGGRFTEVVGALGPDTKPTRSVAWGDMDGDGDLDLAVGNDLDVNQVFQNTRQGGQALPNNAPSLRVTAPYTASANFYASAAILDSPTIPITYTLSDPESDSVGYIVASYSLDGGGRWLEAVPTNTATTNLAASPLGTTHVFTWDTFASDVFGQSDNVVYRLEAYPQPVHTGITNTYRYTNSTPGPYQRPYAAAATFPFRVRGTQVRVLSGTVPISNALVYHLPKDWPNWPVGGFPFADGSGTPFRTDQRGFLRGRGQIAKGDQLLALVPVHTAMSYEGMLVFDGVDDYVIKNPLHNVPITETTISVWMLSVDTTGSGTPLSYATSDEDDALLITNYNDFTIHRGGIHASTGISATDGLWHHIAVTWRDSDDQVKLYKDGVAEFTGTLTATSLITGGSLVLGQNQNSVGEDFEAEGAFSGALDEVRIWNVARTEAQIRADMFRPLKGDEPGLVAYWPFNDSSDNTTPDQTGNGNDGTLAGPTWVVNSLGGYTVYHTNGAPAPTIAGLDAFTVTHAGVQTLTVTAEHPLVLFDLDLSLEWDAHNDPVYRQQLKIDLWKASQHLYDFTDGQVALGHVTVFQNGENWGSSHVVVYATNRVRPFAVQGGTVLTPTVDPDHDDIVYHTGQVHMGATWNRYGEPGQNPGGDWPLALAHELSHYLLYLDDVYLGLDENGLLIPVDTCTGSAMGDMYVPDNTEFIYGTDHWNDKCANTLAAKTLERTEWKTIHLWYPWLVSPLITNTGPQLMPFDLTTVEVLPPFNPTDTLADPTFFLDYQDENQVSSSEARAFLLCDGDGNSEDFEYLYDLGSPIGGQNRLLARGAQPDDRLCIFDQPRHQYGCEVIAIGDERLKLEQDPNWAPVIQLSPVNSTTLDIQVAALPAGLTLQARLYPEYGFGGEVITLIHTGEVYSGTFTLDYPPLAGHVQVWVDETSTEINPRREAIVAYAIGGNPGGDRGGGPLDRGGGPLDQGGGPLDRGGGPLDRGGGPLDRGGGPLDRGGGPLDRGGGPLDRGGGPLDRGGGPLDRGGGAPLVSPGGQMIFFTENPIIFNEGELYAIQSMASLPSLPEGKVAIGQGYNLAASANVTRVITGSISFQYLTIDVLVERVCEENLTIHFWDENGWQELDTSTDAYYNLASAPSQGSGMYALLGEELPPCPTDSDIPPAPTPDTTNYISLLLISLTLIGLVAIVVIVYLIFTMSD